MKKLSPKAIAVIVIVILVGGIGAWWAWGRSSRLPSDLLSREQAQAIVLQILEADAEKNTLIAYLYPNVLRPGDKVQEWDEDAPEREVKNYTWLAWIDRDPGNVFYGHPIQFIYINARSGEYELTEQELWPVINGDSFEGELSDMISVGELSQEVKKAISFPGAQYTTEEIKNLFGIEAQAAEVQKSMRITTNPNFAPDGEYYAVIVSGFGRNAWVFLEGAHLMYDALIKLNYDADHITFLAPYPAKLSESWDRVNLTNPPLDPSDRVDEATSPTHLTSVLTGLRKKMTERDSLFIFMLTHGKKGKFAMGAPVSARQRMGAHDLRKGSSANYSSSRFADLAVGRMKACELMILIDSCYAGTHEKALRAAYDPEDIKRLAVAHSAQDTISYGADYRRPASGTPVLADFDNGAAETPITDPNKTDRGGEFSSGFISNMGLGVFSAAYNAGAKLDAANLNGSTSPYMWSLGEDGPCVVQDTGTVTPEPQDQPQTPQDEPQDQPTEPETPQEPQEPEQPQKKKISVIPYQDTYIPYDQLRAYSAEACECCDEAHFHAKNGVSVTTIDGRTINDPFKNCGFGKASETPVIQIEVDE